MATTKVSIKNTKQELVAAYNQLAKELKTVKTSGGASEAAAAGAPAGGGDAGGGDGELSIADIVERLKALTLSIGESSSALQSALSAEATELHRLRAEADGFIEQLRALHEIEVGPDTLSTLIKQHGETAKAADAELSEKRKTFDKEMSAARAAWKKEQDEHTSQAKEAAAQLKKARQRDAQEYKYAIERQHKAENDVLEQARKAFAQELADLEERKRSEWAEREKAIAEREKELGELTKKSDAFEAELETATKKAEAEGTGIAKRQTKTQADLKKKDNEAIQRVLELKIAALQDTIGKQDAQIEELTRALDQARKQTTELAVKAIDGASNASSFAAIKEIALEQAKNTQKSK
jgi:DNA repair exonuclease SbcCD ATPase subunit